MQPNNVCKPEHYKQNGLTYAFLLYAVNIGKFNDFADNGGNHSCDGIRANVQSAIRTKIVDLDNVIQPTFSSPSKPNLSFVLFIPFFHVSFAPKTIYFSVFSIEIKSVHTQQY